MANYKLVLEYDGTNYHGFQIQPNGITIQGCLESALSQIAKEPVRVIAAGRTDAGVHALYQVVNFHSNLSVPLAKLPIAINSLLPEDIRVKQAAIVSDQFHARYDAIAKTYCYYIQQGPVASVFHRHYCWHIKAELNWDNILQAGKKFEGVHDFRAFAASGSNVKSTVRNLIEFHLQVQDNWAELRFTANGFLYNMVRNMVGTLVEVGLGKRVPESIPAILASKERAYAGVTAPAAGLFLTMVYYPDNA